MFLEAVSVSYPILAVGMAGLNPFRLSMRFEVVCLRLNCLHFDLRGNSHPFRTLLLIERL